MRKLLGILFCAILAAFAYIIAFLPFAPFSIHQHNMIIHPLEPMVLAIVIGIICGNVFFRQRNNATQQNLQGVISSKILWSKLSPGANFAAKSLLPLGVVLMGVKFDLLAVLKVSGQALLINLVCLLIAYSVTMWLCKKLGVDDKMSALITIGTAICGGSAIVAAAPVVKASQTQVAIAMTIVSLYGLIAIFVLPLIGHALGMSQFQFGVWAGVSIQAVPQVVAAGFAFGIIAGQTATIVKMVRILLLAPMVMWIAAKSHKLNEEKTEIKSHWRQFFPMFILYFLLMVIANTLGLFSYLDEWTHLPISHYIAEASAFFMTMAMIGVGLNTDLITLFKSGGKPLLSGGLAMLILLVISLLMIMLI
ncbi:YeiH family protein [Fangia hongkongensis]|uniref:YeiH family protein n=1 Tax=Fangia hongkongensis TaxID=270495 RepID=UPI000374269B|nr:putative sulfate exporter family transporter [Fangia hongkongensis]MBK2123741.1 putative sulfate exporter family transporter [Fangia hongkongensis]